MTTLQKPAVATPVSDAGLTPLKETLDTLSVCPGFIEAPAPTQPSVRSVFVCSGNAPSPLYFLEDGFRRHLPAWFVGTVTDVSIIEREYDQANGPIQKLVLNCTVANECYAFWMGGNTWAAQTLLQALALLTAEQLQEPLLFKAVAGRRTVFFNLATATDGDWQSVGVPEELFSRKLEADEMMLLAGAIHEQLN